MNVEKRVSYTDILIELPQIKSNNFVKHYQQSFKYESKIYLYTTCRNIILFLQQIYRLKGASLYRR